MVRRDSAKVITFQRCGIRRHNTLAACQTLLDVKVAEKLTWPVAVTGNSSTKECNLICPLPPSARVRTSVRKSFSMLAKTSEFLFRTWRMLLLGVLTRLRRIISATAVANIVKSEPACGVPRKIKPRTESRMSR